MKWPEELTQESLEKVAGVKIDKELDQPALEHIAELAAPYNFDLENHGAVYTDYLGDAIRQTWNGGRIQKAPLTNIGAPTPYPSDMTAFYAVSRAGYGWVVHMRIERAFFPDLVALRENMRHIRDERNEVIIAYVKGL